MSAMSPSGTGAFVPRTRPFVIVVLRLFALGRPAPSDNANVPIASPDASFGNHFSFCAREPASINASVARYTDDENGIGATARPSSSATTDSSKYDKPSPPYSSGIAVAVHPSSEIFFHNV